ncbi:MAG: ankyrin repeat domain-containing protein [Acidobacteria bacterium]|nr:ankyrin repeat domain-containing protein [Acidobacteriota bacterium]
MLHRMVFAGFTCLAVWAQTTAADIFAAIRSNDLARLRAVTAAELALRDKSGVTPLLYSAAMGSLDGLKTLVERGADVNAADNGGSTPLLWAACDPARVSVLLAKGASATAKTKAGRTALMAAAGCEAAEESVKMLLAKGAGVNDIAQDRQTPLMEAAFNGSASMMRLLVNAGADVNTADEGGWTPLMGAVGWGDVALVKTMLAKGAKVNAANVFAGKVVHGDIVLKQLTPLMFATPYGSPEMVKALLDAGADVNAKDVRGMNSLQFAVASSSQDLRVVKMLLAKGVDVSAVSTAGETALDWARKFGSKEVIAELEKAGAKGSPVPAVPSRAGTPAASAKAAAEKSVGLLQSAADSFFAKSNCVACHHQPMAALAVKAARQAGVPVDEKRMDSMKKSMVALLAPRPSAVLGMQVGPAGTDGLSNTTLALASAGQEPGLLTDSATAYLAARQNRDGSWRESSMVARTPMSDSLVTMTIHAMRAMQLYVIPSRKAEIDARVAKAKAWLASVRPRTSFERAEILLGLGWAGADAATLRKAGAALVKDQHSDGGWAQMAGLGSDAYATALALRAMRESGIADRNKAACEKAVAYLLRTQMDDGSWYVRSRAVKLQPYFQSGFPYDHEQWISYVATANATVALLR